MTRGRKSKTATGIGCALIALLLSAVLAPSFAGAQAAADEYNLTLPGAGQGGADGPASTGAGAEIPDGGGTPILPIALAAAATLCIAIAIWRMRGRSIGGTGRVRETAPGSETG